MLHPFISYLVLATQGLSDTWSGDQHGTMAMLLPVGQGSCDCDNKNA